MKNRKMFHRGYYIEMGMILALPPAIPLGLLLGNIVWGYIILLPLGIAVGSYLEKRFNTEPLELTPREKKKRFILLGSGAGLGLLTLILIFVL